MKIEVISKKQKQILKWAHKKSCEGYDNIICDGSVRSGKTVFMTMGFILWAMRNYNGHNFAICSKTVGTAERNIISVLMTLDDMQELFIMTYTRSQHILTVTAGGVSNKFYVFGGKDESSYMLIQGMTLAGVLFDEVALMPQSFVDQAIARTLSVKRSKLWFNCNPDNPYHWFKQEWIDDADGENKKKSLHLHFLMSDNPILTSAEIEKAEALYEGVFYQRYILGLWVAAEGRVYPMFDEKLHVCDTDERIYYDYYGERRLLSGKYYVSIDYGTLNPCSMGLWFVPDKGNAVYRIDEYYHDGRESGEQLTDEQYYDKLCELCGGRDIERVIIDPSAASFITLIRQKRRFFVRKAENDVIDGIRYTSGLINRDMMFFDKKCRSIIKEFNSYLWDEKAVGEDKVIKEHDHAMDDMRYFAMTVLRHDERFNYLDVKPKKAGAPMIDMNDINADWS